MLRTFIRSFVYAQAVVGVVLTINLAAGCTDIDTITGPMFSLGALLVLYSFISSSLVRLPSRLEGLAGIEDAKQLLSGQKHDEHGPSRLSRFAIQHRLSIQWAMAGLILLLMAWALLAFAPPLSG